MVKWALASIPAFLILGVIAIAVGAAGAIVIRGIGAAALGGSGSVAGTAAPSFLDRANASTAKSDLRNLVTAQEAFFSDSGYYSQHLSRLAHQATVGTTVTLERVDRLKWAARAVRPGGVECWIAINMDVNQVAPISVPRAVEGEPVCKQ